MRHASTTGPDFEAMRRVIREAHLADPLPDLDPTALLFQLWKEPSFGAWGSWSIFSSGGRAVLRRVLVGVRAQPVPRGPGLPNAAVSDSFATEVQVDPADAEAWLAELPDHPPVGDGTPSAPALDGIMCGASWHSPRGLQETTWRAPGPLAFQDLAARIAELVGRLEALLPAARLQPDEGLERDFMPG